jgi:hypothetical protein
MQQPLVAARIAAIRRKRPDASPAEVIRKLGTGYQLAGVVTGGVGGAIAIVPAIGTVTALATATAEAVAALDASILYVLAVAEVHALPTETLERRRALVLGIIMGESGQAALSKMTGKSGNWAQDITNALPLSKLGPLNMTLSRWFIKRYVIRQSVLALGRALPLGIGIVIGATGNFVIASQLLFYTTQQYLLLRLQAVLRAQTLAPMHWQSYLRLQESRLISCILSLSSSSSRPRASKRSAAWSIRKTWKSSAPLSTICRGRTTAGRHREPPPEHSGRAAEPWRGLGGGVQT